VLQRAQRIGVVLADGAKGCVFRLQPSDAPCMVGKPANQGFIRAQQPIERVIDAPATLPPRSSKSRSALDATTSRTARRARVRYGSLPRFVTFDLPCVGLCSMVGPIRSRLPIELDLDESWRQHWIAIVVAAWSAGSLARWGDERRMRSEAVP
jgi:hypothetical protein